MGEPLLSRQPTCRYCEHDEHVFARCLLEISDTGAMCPCPPHKPNGIYEEPS